MQLLLYFFFVFLNLSLQSDVIFRCPPGTVQSPYNHNRKTCYLAVNSSNTFDEAERFCNGQGGHLSVVSDNFLNNFLTDTALYNFGNFDKYWIGGTIITIQMNAEKTIGVWGWTKNNELMAYNDWNPVNTSTGNCTGVDSRSLWSAIDCAKKYPFICQIPATFSYCDEGWTYYNGTNSCYKKYASNNMITQAQAEISCNQNGGHLTSIQSFPENDFIRELSHIGLITGWQASVL